MSRAAPLPSRKFICLIGALVLLWLLLTGMFWKLISPSESVDEVELKHVGFHLPLGPLPVYGLDRARGDFKIVSINDETYKQTPPGSSLITRQNHETKFIIYQELYSSWLPIPFQTLKIIERRTGRVIARNLWLCADHWCGGFGGAKNASDFVKWFLGRRDYSRYPDAIATVKEHPTTTLVSISELNQQVFNCPSDFDLSIRKDLNQMSLSNSLWSYVPSEQASQVHCLPSGIFITSGTFPETLNIDWLSYTGETLGQFGVKLPLSFPASGGGPFYYAKSIKEHQGTISLHMLYVHNNWPKDGERKVPDWEYEVKITGFKWKH